MKIRLLAIGMFLVGLVCLAQAQFNGCQAGFCSKIAVGGAAAVTWDPANTDSAIALSSGNLTESITLPDTDNRLSRAIVGVAVSSKKYWEVLCNTCSSFTNALGLGFVDGSFTIPQNNFLGFDSHSVGYYGSGGTVFTGGSSGPTWEIYASSSNVIAFAIDTVNNKMWAQLLGGAGWNNDIIANQNPALNIGGLAISFTPPLYPAVVFRSGTGEVFQIIGRFSTGSWTGTAPVGFTQL